MLQQQLFLYFTGFSRNASEIAEEQIRKTPDKKRELQVMSEMVEEAVRILNRESDDIIDFGRLLNESWKIKRGLTGLISANSIDDIYSNAIKSGAIGGKLLGAGGGGFMLFFVPKEKQELFMDKMQNLLSVPFSFDTLGTQIVLYSTQDSYQTRLFGNDLRKSPKGDNIGVIVLLAMKAADLGRW